MNREGMKGYYTMMNNVKNHDNKRVLAYITPRGYEPYLPFLNSIEEFSPR
jgi:hypothetical protein